MPTKAPVTFCNMLIKLFLITHIPNCLLSLNHKPKQHNSHLPNHTVLLFRLKKKKTHIEQCWGSLTTSLSLSPVKTLFISLPVFFTSCNLQFLVTGYNGLAFGCNLNGACVFSEEMCVYPGAFGVSGVGLCSVMDLWRNVYLCSHS